MTAFVEAGYFAPGTQRDCVIVGDRATLAADFGSSEVRVLRQPARAGTAVAGRPSEGGVEMIKAAGPRAAPPGARAVPRAAAAGGGRCRSTSTRAWRLRVVEAAQRSSELGRRVEIVDGA